MIVVVACGNLNRSDDGVGAEVLRLLAERHGRAGPPGVKLLNAGTDGLAVMFAARGAQSLIVIDACRSDSQPGALFEVPAEALIHTRALGLSTHDFRWEDALAAGRSILKDAFPRDVTVLLIEAEHTGLGLSLSEPVAAAARTAAERIDAMLAARLPTDAILAP